MDKPMTQEEAMRAIDDAVRAGLIEITEWADDGMPCYSVTKKGRLVLEAKKDLGERANPDA